MLLQYSPTKNSNKNPKIYKLQFHGSKTYQEFIKYTKNRCFFLYITKQNNKKIDVSSATNWMLLLFMRILLLQHKINQPYPVGQEKKFSPPLVLSIYLVLPPSHNNYFNCVNILSYINFFKMRKIIGLNMIFVL